ncbi:ribose 5-phosphate isomerase B [Halobacteriovorax sp. GFR7]|uniref:ribose 5-phosphate isomerase B n=1 Tax=unclassified Halobacteriovorax TaxID=2639665 RepID=UPI003D99237A
MSKKIFLATDHGAFKQKEAVKKFLIEEGYEVEDLGTHSSESCHYPEYAIALAKAVQKEGRGILLCGSGIGVCMVANKFKGIRAALCHNVDLARLSREHNNANVICFGGRISTSEEVLAMTKVWLATEFEGGRHQTRIDMFTDLGEN